MIMMINVEMTVPQTSQSFTFLFILIINQNLIVLKQYHQFKYNHDFDI